MHTSSSPKTFGTTTLRVGLMLTLIALAPAAMADCVDGSRDRTPQEQAFAAKLTASLKAALPAAPAPLLLEREPQVIVQSVCKDTPVGKVSALVSGDYAASLHYSDRVKVTLRTNYAYPDANDLVLGTLPKKPAPFKVQNLVVKVDGHNANYVGALKQAIDRDRLQALIDQPLPDVPPAATWTVGRPGSAAAQASASAPGGASAGTTPVQPAPANKPEQAPDSAGAVADKAKDAVNKLRGLLGR